MFKNSSSCFYVYNGKLIAEIVYTVHKFKIC